MAKSKTTTSKSAKPRRSASKQAPTKRLNLALQGGGAHGAFTWGVLDRLLEDDLMDLDGLSGTSAGAMNAVVMASGLTLGGAAQAREDLATFWRAVSDAAALSPFRRSPLDVMLGNWSVDNSPSFVFFDLWSRMTSPYDVNPMNYNPLGELVNAHVDWDAVHCCTQVKLFISATNVRTGKVRIFRNSEMSTDAVLASACLPFLYQAVEIEGDAYWDGGYSGNPVLFPFVYETDCRDILIVQINPVERPDIPKSAREILNRLNEITFNGALLKELRAINFVAKQVGTKQLDESRYKQMRLHRIAGDETLLSFGASSKLNAEWEFLCKLRDLGRAACQTWIEGDGAKVGVESSLDLDALIDNPEAQP